MSKRTLIGLMSGTSHDGIDAVLVDIARARRRFRIRQRAFRSFPYARAVRARLLRLSQAATLGAGEVSQVNVLLGELFARAALRLCRAAGVSPDDIDAVGSHGHTIYHQPRQRPGPGSTLQIGEPAVIAGLTGITTVADFRPADVALGGEGAPLVPYVHACLFQRPDRSVAVHNVGGIANLTYLPATRGDGGPAEVVAFDTGPGNVVIDGVVHAVTDGRRTYDRNGRLGRTGTVHAGLLRTLLRHSYFKRTPPKSTGREEFGGPFIARFLERAARLGLSAADQVATATALTADSMAGAYRDCILPRGGLAEIYVTGGGALNPTLLERFAARLPETRVRPLEDAGYDPQSLEALAFAILAYATLHGLPSNVPSATGADRPAVLGKIVPGRNYRNVRLNAGATRRNG